MTPTRRAVTLSLAASLAPAAACAQMPMNKKPLVIAHRGASGERPEHTLMGYRLAIAEGADVIEPDLVVTKDRVLVCRHEKEISGTTDIASIPRFADRKTVRTESGREIVEYNVEDLTLGEFQSLRAKERIPQIRPGNVQYNGLEAPPTFQQVIDLAKSESTRLGRTIGIYPELKSPAELLAKGYDTGAMLLDALNRASLPSPRVPVFIQSFESEALRRIKGRTQAKLVQLTQTASMTTSGGLAAIKAYADGVGAEKSLVNAAMVEEAHRLGLFVHVWTFRAENSFLPTDLRKGTDPTTHGDMATEIKRYMAMGIDGMFSDFPGLAIAARG